MDMLNRNSLGNPSICYYDPKFSYTEKNSPRALRFDYKHGKKQVSKQYLLQKMWCSYDVSSDYKLVELKNFVENNR